MIKNPNINIGFWQNNMGDIIARMMRENDLKLVDLAKFRIKFLQGATRVPVFITDQLHGLPI